MNVIFYEQVTSKHDNIKQIGLSMLDNESVDLRTLISVVACSGYKCVYQQHRTADALICSARAN
jgi:hypothetical protein